MCFFVVFLTPNNEHTCSETDFTQEKGILLDDHFFEILFFSAENSSGPVVVFAFTFSLDDTCSATNSE